MSDYIKDLFSLEGKGAVVTGGGGVLCGRMCYALSQAGAEVVVADMHEENGQARVAELTAAGGKASFVKVDVTSRASIENLLESAKAAMGTVDILINGAGVNSALPYFKIDDESWDRVLNINLRALHQCCQVFSAHMVEQGTGCIINMGSASAITPLSRVFAYSASKAAVVNYTQNLARELGTTGVRVNAISPGFFPAEQNRKILDEERIASIMGKTPMNRFGEPEELDGTILLLASDRAGKFVTGANFIVDGGFAAMSI